ncbi:uncharacterized protein LOC119191690 [Manduca sexta]|uniref:uncharacterized protein LOC119191690 n=1 Tax=Manduca sexta TaxID=7130 RepID=UPI00188EABD2|nr:uncharacterized protein LOC119191690 [Manduca sexta]
MSSYLTFHDFSIHLMNRSLNVSFYTTSFISTKILLIGNQRAKWEYIERLYKVDGFGGRARSTKLTEKHINPTSYDKMKVKFAAQVFSRQVATSLEIQMKSLLSFKDHDYISLNKDIGNGLFTAEILLL